MIKLYSSHTLCSSYCLTLGTSFGLYEPIDSFHLAFRLLLPILHLYFTYTLEPIYSISKAKVMAF